VVAREGPSPEDYEVTSVARECADEERGNRCEVDADELGATCYSSCTTHYCNDQTPRPSWRDLLRHRLSRPASSHDTPASDDDKNGDSPPPADTSGIGKLLIDQL